MPPTPRRLRAALAAGLLGLALMGCTEEPATTQEGETEQPVPGEPGAPEPSPDPTAGDVEDAATDLPDEDEDGTATRGD